MEIDKIICGDAYELIKAIPDKSIDCIITDPPYEYDEKTKWFQSKLSDETKQSHGGLSEMMKKDSLKGGVRSEIMDEWVRVLKKISIFIFCNKAQLLDYINYFVTEKKCNWELLIWGKSNPVPLANGSFVHDKEYCLNFWEKGAYHRIKDINHGKTVYSIPINQKDSKEFGHPTCKPVSMVRNFVEIGTQDGGVILDTFMGSGTTAVACVETNRHFIGFEKNQHWVDVANDRIKGITQKDRFPSKGVEQYFLF